MNLILPSGAFVPQEVTDRLRQIDPGIKVVVKQRMVHDSGAENDRQELQYVWYVALAWPDNDPRWQRVKWGQVDPDNAFDLLGEIPADCPLEQIPGYLAKQLKRTNGHPGQICDQVAAWNRDQSLRNGAVTSEFAEELFQANQSTLFAKDGVTPPKPVYQHNPQQTGRKNRPKEA